jgi:hypothetical protein
MEWTLAEQYECTYGVEIMRVREIDDRWRRKERRRGDRKKRGV